MAAVSTSYNIKLEQFEGPFDLLLFFIERDEIDIYNIPIFTITNDFLHYIQQMENMNIEMASEFILFASTLMRIKAKMLLPRKDMDEFGNEIDPRKELIDKILEYKRFKEAAEDMKLMEAERMLQFKRGNALKELADIGETMSEGTEIQSVTLFKLFQNYEKVMKRIQDQIPSTVETLEVVAFDRMAQTGVIHISWGDVWDFAEGNINGNQLGSRMIRMAATP